MATINTPPPPPQWLSTYGSPPPSKASKSSNFADPPGYTSPTAVAQKGKGSSSSKAPVAVRKELSQGEMDSLKVKKAWELAIAPAKQLPMSAFGMYMAGNSLQIFSIFMLVQLFQGPIRALSNIHGTFQRLETDSNKQQMLLVKAAFVACNCLALALGIYKVNSMGLLP